MNFLRLLLLTISTTVAIPAKATTCHDFKCSKKEEIERTIAVVTSLAYQNICKVDFDINVDSIKLAQFMLNNKHKMSEVFKNGYELCSEWKSACFKSCEENGTSYTELFVTLLIVNVQKNLEGSVDRKFCNVFKK